MKKLTLTIIIGMTVILQSFGQLNPINNLEWNHWYICPNNYFILSWDFPDPSLDTLIGYNIYRDTELYRFQTETSLYHTEAGGNCGVDFVAFSGDFWIHVTAVYNSTYLESNYIDSAYCYGFYIGIDERIQPKLKLFPNPATGIIKVDIQKNIKRILIINQSGIIVQENKEKIEIDLSNFPKGIYFIKVITEQGEFVEKIILE
ncbi:MAG: T9SS type A sorting domain-containing protein [Bacteroidales bacterium]|nr:T9SS type A sorting domain-containing protein [Bacteroidales bacterium]